MTKFYLFKKWTFVAASCILLNTLTGCTTFTQQRLIKADCATQTVLITDLTQTTNPHRSQLPSGEACPNEAI